MSTKRRGDELTSASANGRTTEYADGLNAEGIKSRNALIAEMIRTMAGALRVKFPSAEPQQVADALHNFFIEIVEKSPNVDSRQAFYEKMGWFYRDLAFKTMVTKHEMSYIS